MSIPSKAIKQLWSPHICVAGVELFISESFIKEVLWGITGMTSAGLQVKTLRAGKTDYNTIEVAEDASFIMNRARR